MVTSVTLDNGGPRNMVWLILNRTLHANSASSHSRAKGKTGDLAGQLIPGAK
jgi:hypothetical protein